MKLAPLSPEAAQAKMSKARSRARKIVLQCAMNPKPDSVHEARIAIRKLRASVSLTPRKYRKDPVVKTCMQKLEEFYSDAARLRDIDTITGELTKAGRSGSDRLMQTLAKRRSVRLRQVESRARGMSVVRLPSLPRLKENALAKRLNKVVTGLADEIGKLHSTSLESDREVARLHRLRKKCRELMYVLEYAKPNGNTKRAERLLEEARLELGSIMDDDIVLEFLWEVKAPPQLRSKFAHTRHAKFMKLVSSESNAGKSGLLAAVSALA
jgi:CHAD domain-containing protein